MSMDPASVTLLAIAATMVVGFGGIVVTIHSTANATNRRMDDFREDTNRRLADFRADVDRQLADLRIDFRDMRGRVDYIADSLSLGRARAKKRA